MTDQTPELTATGAKPLLTVSESAELLNGYDELRIERLFGKPPVSYGEEQPSLTGSLFLRALLFANQTRDGVPEDQAFASVMQLTTTQLNDGTRFGSGSEDIDPDTESGKDASTAS